MKNSPREDFHLFIAFSMANTKRPSQQRNSQKKTKRVVMNQPQCQPQCQPRDHDHPQIPSAPFLPEELIENVLTFLPVKHAMNAGTVAKSFARSWALSRHLVFDTDCHLVFTSEDLVPVVDRIFDSHRGSEILSFTLLMDPVGVESSIIEKWLRICIDKGLKHLDLNLFRSGFTLGAELLDIPTLRTLKLAHCGIQLPPVIRGLQFLHTLFLRRIELTEMMLQTLVCCCKMLSCLDMVMCTRIRIVNIYAGNHRHFKTLKIGSCYDVERIGIDAPTLRSFFYCGNVPVIRIANFIKLDEAYVHFLPKRDYIQSYNMEILVADLFHVKILTISAGFIEALAARVRDETFRDAKFGLRNLRELQLFMEGGQFCNPYDIAVFLTHCPALETLIIDMNGYCFDCGAYWELHQKPYLDSFGHCFSRLRFVKLAGFKFLQSELELVKILLQKSTILEALIFITPNKGQNHYPFNALKYNQLLQSWKTSSVARIFLYEHCNDRSCVIPTHEKYWY